MVKQMMTLQKMEKTMKKTIAIATLLLTPSTAFAWDDPNEKTEAKKPGYSNEPAVGFSLHAGPAITLAEYSVIGPLIGGEVSLTENKFFKAASVDVTSFPEVDAFACDIKIHLGYAQTHGTRATVYGLLRPVLFADSESLLAMGFGGRFAYDFQTGAKWGIGPFVDAQASHFVGTEFSSTGWGGQISLGIVARFE
jgi:hypothetical protein